MRPRESNAGIGSKPLSPLQEGPARPSEEITGGKISPFLVGLLSYRRPDSGISNVVRFRTHMGEKCSVPHRCMEDIGELRANIGDLGIVEPAHAGNPTDTGVQF